MEHLTDKIKAIRTKKKIRLSAFEEIIMERVRTAEQSLGKKLRKEKLKRAFDELAKVESRFFNFRQKTTLQEKAKLQYEMKYWEDIILGLLETI